MRITDIIRGVLDLADMVADAQQPQPDAIIALAQQEQEPQDDGMLAIIQQLAGVPVEQPTYANEPQEMTAGVSKVVAGGNDEHQRKNPADIRTDAPSMYPGYQAEKR